VTPLYQARPLANLLGAVIDRLVSALDHLGSPVRGLLGRLPGTGDGGGCGRGSPRGGDRRECTTLVAVKAIDAVSSTGSATLRAPSLAPGGHGLPSTPCCPRAGAPNSSAWELAKQSELLPKILCRALVPTLDGCYERGELSFLLIPRAI
jgi:hypothetical protein